MAKGACILINGGQPNGRFIEGIINDASYPGMCVELVPATEPVNGRFTYRASSVAAGSAKPIIVLLEDSLQGGLVTQVYTAGARAFFYEPHAGDELNMLVKNIAGTGDHFAIGDKMSVDNTGKLVAGTGTVQPFQVEETQAAGITADTLLAMIYTGSY